MESEKKESQPKDKKAAYLEGPVRKTLLFHSLPMLIGIGAALSFSLVDTYFVAKLGTDPLAALTFSFPIVFTINGVAFGLATGASAVISRALGSGNNYLVQRYTTDAIILAVLLVVLFLLGAFLSFDTAFILMGATPELMPLIKEYMTIWLLGAIFLVPPLVGNSATRATGDTKTPSMIMMVAVLINLILDPILIFGWGPIPAYGLAGAAWATLIARFVIFWVSFYVLGKRDKMLTFVKPKIAEILNSWKEILNVGLPTVITNLIMPVGLAVVTKFVSEYGTEAVAALGAASRVETLGLVVFMALGSVLGPFIGQNFGAGKFDRIKLSLRESVYFSIGWGAFCTILFYFFNYDIAVLIKEDPKVAEIIALYLPISALGFAFRGIGINGTIALNVLKKPYWSMLINVLQMFIIFIPLAYLGSSMFGLVGIFWAGVVSSVITSFISITLARLVVRREEGLFESKEN